MKKTFFKSILRDLKKNISRFVAIIAIVALGVGFLIGLLSATPNLKISMDNYYDSTNTYDVMIKSTIGFSTEDIEELKKENSTISEIEGFYQYDEIGFYLSQEVTTRLINKDLNSSIDQFKLIEGRYPQQKNECIVVKNGIFLSEVNLSSNIIIGDQDYTIVGVCESPVYYYKINEMTTIGDGSLDMILYVDSQYQPSHPITDIVLTISSAQELLTFDKAYQALTKKMVQKLENSSQKYLDLRLNLLKDEAYDEVYSIIYATTKMEVTKALEVFFSGEELEYQVMIKLNSMIPEMKQLAQEQLNENFAKIDAKWYVLDRTSNLSYASFEENANKVDSIAVVFPFFFFFIAGLIALTSITRMVTEDRIIIGTLKSLGYSKKTILSKYLFYSLFACVIGCILGIVTGVYLLPSIIYQAYNSIFVMPAPIYQWILWVILIATVSMIGTIIIVTVVVCLNSLKEKPNALLIPKAPRPGKRILLERIHFIWNRLKFKNKSSLRNVFRFKRNLIMMIVGIGGCTALILVAFGLSDSIGGFTKTQYEDVIQYDVSVKTTQHLEMESILSDSKTMQLTSFEGYPVEKEEIETTIYVCTDEILEFMNLEVKTFNEDSVIISTQLASLLKVKVSQQIKMQLNEEEHTFKVTSIFDNYIGNYVILHEKQMDSLERNHILIQFGEQDKIRENEILSSLNVLDGIERVESISQTALNYSSMSNSIGLVIFAVILCSGALAVIVIYNLTNININERTKEIATLKVLGYQRREVCGYIYREIIFMSLLGILVGFALGAVLNYYVMDRISSIGLYFSPYLKGMNYLYGFCITIVFVLIVLAVFIPKIKKIKMVESLKCLE